ncbi:CU044_5270 family protein [Actinoplanes sp. NPDC023801]|uniref:CU044_5270 family protein n=1 Tax=Actinoplanes sp. NPDC023801 TaxID=3154595 RepID=UPI0033F65D5B
MNDTELRAELAALLPKPAGPRMPRDTLLRRRARLLAEIDRGTGSPVRRKGLLLILAPVAAVVVTALAATVVAAPWDRGSAPPIVQVLPGDHDAAVEFLNGLALSGARSAPERAEGRYLYVRSRVAFVAFSGGADGEPVEAKLQEPHDREIWKPLFVGGNGLVREDGESIDTGAARPVDLQPELPDDPEALLTKIYAESKGQGHSSDGQAFTVIGDLLSESLLSPEQTAVLYRAAARIPGVELVPDAVDAIGRHGVAVARTEQSRRREWIFDRATGQYLGERSYLVEDTEYGRTGMLLSTTAETTRAVVGRIGTRP